MPESTVELRESGHADEASFDDIRCYEDFEVETVIQRLLNDQKFVEFISNWRLPRLNQKIPPLAHLVVRLTLHVLIGRVKTIEQFQQKVELFVRKIVKESITTFNFQGFDQLDKYGSYVFMSNHRDIAGDSMLLNYALFKCGFRTARIAVGDNLIQRQFATDLMKLNKSFFIKRSVEGAKKLFAALHQASAYIRWSLGEGNSVWIAQREGRCKDGMDETDPAVIKMLTLSVRKENFSESIRNLNIVPMSLSYEFDPCDDLKARELNRGDSEGGYEKEEGEDLLSLVKGLVGFKGNVTLRLGSVVDGNFNDADEVAMEVDRQIVAGLELFPINFWALSMIEDPSYREIWERVQAQANSGVSYKERLDTVEPENRLAWLKMYANPVVNKYRRSLL